MREVLLCFQNLFLVDDYGPLKKTTLMEHLTDTGDARLISIIPFYVSPAERERIKDGSRKNEEEKCAKRIQRSLVVENPVDS